MVHTLCWVMGRANVERRIGELRQPDCRGEPAFDIMGGCRKRILSVRVDTQPDWTREVHEPSGSPA